FAAAARTGEGAQLRQQRAGPGQELDAPGGEPQPPSFRLDQGEADLCLQGPDPLAQRRLGDPQPHRRLAHRPAGLEGGQGVEAIKHIPIVTISYSYYSLTS